MKKAKGVSAAAWFYAQPGFHGTPQAAPAPVPVRHAKSVENPDWPYESYCVGCGEEWPCAAVRPGEAR